MFLDVVCLLVSQFQLIAFTCRSILTLHQRSMSATTSSQTYNFDSSVAQISAVPMLIQMETFKFRLYM